MLLIFCKINSFWSVHEKIFLRMHMGQRGIKISIDNARSFSRKKRFTTLRKYCYVEITCYEVFFEFVFFNGEM